MPRVVAATVGLVVAFAVVRGGNLSNRYGVNCGELCVRHKPWDKAMFVATVVVAGLLCVYFLLRRPSRAARVAVSIFAVGGLLVGIARIERSGQRVQFGAPVLPRFIWEGFGVPVAIAASCLAVFLWRALDRIETSRALRVVLTTGIGVVAFVDLASLVRTLSNFFEPNDNQYVLNEVLAPAAGKVPGATFVPQYVNLYGWLLVPLRHFMSPRGLAQSAMILLSVLGLLSVVLAVTIAYRSMSSPSFWFAAGVIVPLTCVTVMHGATPWSSIGSALQELPIRVFPAMLLSFLGLEELSRRRAGSVRTWRLPALGVLAGLIAWNCQDFGVAIVIAYSVLLVVALPAAKLRKSLALWAAGVFGGLALYPVLTVLAGTPIRLDQIALFTRAYGNGFGADLIQVPGPVLVVLPLILSSVAVGWCLLWRRRRSVPTGDVPNDRTVLTLALVGTWALGGFVYYLNRSYASGQLQILLMPCGVCAVALVSLCARRSCASCSIEPGPSCAVAANVVRSPAGRADRLVGLRIDAAVTQSRAGVQGSHRPSGRVRVCTARDVVEHDSRGRGLRRYPGWIARILREQRQLHPSRDGSSGSAPLRRPRNAHHEPDPVACRVRISGRASDHVDCRVGERRLGKRTRHLWLVLPGRRGRAPAAHTVPSSHLTRPLGGRTRASANRACYACATTLDPTS